VRAGQENEVENPSGAANRTLITASKCAGNFHRYHETGLSLQMYLTERPLLFGKQGGTAGYFSPLIVGEF
jgi:hypothetical protein